MAAAVVVADAVDFSPRAIASTQADCAGIGKAEKELATLIKEVEEAGAIEARAQVETARNDKAVCARHEEARRHKARTYPDRGCQFFRGA